MTATLALALGVAHLLPFQGRTYVHGALLNVGHILAFGAAAWLLTVRPIVREWPWWVWAAGLAVLGLMLEAAQMFTSRDASVSDWFRDLAGIATGTLVALSMRHGWRRRVLLVAAAAGVFAVAAFAPLRLVASYELRDLAFPVLDDLSGEWRYRLRPIESTLSVLDANGARTLVVALTPARYSGVAWTDPVPDWRGYRAVVLAVRPTDGAAIDLTLRIHDAAHSSRGEDRFRAVFTVPAEGATLEFPLAQIQSAPAGRHMDMSAIRAVVLYTKELGRERTIEVSSLRLR